MRALDWLYGLQGIGVKLGLENMRRLLATLDAPAAAPLTFHVAGTNGKGSVCAFLDSVARAHGLRSGLFTSPHLIRFQERMRVNGELISDDVLTGWLDHLRETIMDWEPHPSFFEVTLALAMAHFYEEKVECLVLETGLGGRLDATNAIGTKHVCVVTPIHYDHTHILGDTLGGIAREKGGIFRRGVPIISAAQLPEVEIALRQAAAAVQASISFVSGPYQGELQLPGEHQRTNAALAKAAFQVAVKEVTESQIQLGLSRTQWPGRFQRFGERYIVDGAHNPASIEALCATWQDLLGSTKATVVFGCAREKSIEALLEMLDELAARFIFVPILSGRSADPQDLQSMVEFGAVAASFRDGLKLAETHSEPVLVTGSLFLAGEAVALLSDDVTPVSTDQ